MPKFGLMHRNKKTCGPIYWSKVHLMHNYAFTAGVNLIFCI